MENQEKSNLNLVVDEERLKDLDLETFYYVDSNPKAMLDFVAWFVADDQGEYLEKKDAVPLVLKGRKIRDIEKLVEDLKDAMEIGALPNE